MRYLFALISMLILASGCASTGSASASGDRYRSLATEPTPSHWKPGATWTFVATNSRGAKDVLTFRISESKVETCSSGDWRKLELLEGNIGTESVPAALVEGRNLLISLTSNVCDFDHEIRGELDDGSFKGERTSGGPFGGTTIGPVQGWRVR